MGTVVENIFSKKLGKKVPAGDIVVVDADASMIQDTNGCAVIDNFEKLDRSVKSPERHLVSLDHFTPCHTVKAAGEHKRMREFARAHGIEDVAEEGHGVCHQRMIESGKVKPGGIVVGTDSHCCHYGVLNAFSTGVGAMDEAVLLASDRCWLKVPESILIRLSGKPEPRVCMKDVALVMIRELTQAGAIYQCLEFCGEALSFFSIDGRAAICNMAVEAGAKGAIMPCDPILESWLAKNGISGYTPTAPDSDAVYAKTLDIDVSAIVPVAAVEPDIDNVVPVRDIEGQRLDLVVIGGCTNGRLEDFEQAAAILKGKKINPGVRLIIAPSSRTIALEMIKNGVYNILLEAGAIILPPGCGPCSGLHGVIADGEVVLSTSNRNMSGRMGSRKGKIIISSPVVAAYSALVGKVSDGEAPDAEALNGIVSAGGGL